MEEVKKQGMESLFVPYEIALALKQLGFDEPCFGLWNLNNGKYEVDIIGVCKYSKEFKYRQVIAPLYQQVFRWFREKYALYGTIKYGNNEFDKSIYLFPCVNGVIVGNDSFKTQEEAELECLKKLIEIIKTP